MSASGIPLIGLVHVCTIKKPDSEGTEWVSDGAGGYTQAMTTSTTSAPCRFSKMVTKGETGDTLRAQGYMGEYAYRVLLKPHNEVDKSWILTTTGQFNVPDGDYRVLEIKQQMNSVGIHHHTSLIVELEGAMTV